MDSEPDAGGVSQAVRSALERMRRPKARDKGGRKVLSASLGLKLFAIVSWAISGLCASAALIATVTGALDLSDGRKFVAIAVALAIPFALSPVLPICRRVSF